MFDSFVPAKLLHSVSGMKKHIFQKQSFGKQQRWISENWRGAHGYALYRKLKDWEMLSLHTIHFWHIWYVFFGESISCELCFTDNEVQSDLFRHHPIWSCRFMCNFKPYNTCTFTLVIDSNKPAYQPYNNIPDHTFFQNEVLCRTMCYDSS